MTTENEVNVKCREWLGKNGYKYKGILNAKPEKSTDENGFGQVPIPDGTRSVLIDHQGVRDRPVDLIWIEAKGSDVGMSQLLEGFIRMVYACYHGGGKGLLAIPTIESARMLEQSDFLRRVAVSCERQVGILDAEGGSVTWLN